MRGAAGLLWVVSRVGSIARVVRSVGSARKSQNISSSKKSCKELFIASYLNKRLLYMQCFIAIAFVPVAISRYNQAINALSHGY